jgi:hypothetical protein
MSLDFLKKAAQPITAVAAEGRISCERFAPTTMRMRLSRENITMILEVAILNIRPGESADFERAFAEAQAIIASIPGYGWGRSADW